ncbi:putative adhesin [Morganella morganii]|uniref:putative adhesin n=1 Tax=Morganella morganii TaxID=582 RepID=UPI0031B49CB5
MTVSVISAATKTIHVNTVPAADAIGSMHDFASKIDCVKNTSEVLSSFKSWRSTLLENMTMLFEKITSLIWGKSDSLSSMKQQTGSAPEQKMGHVDLSRLTPEPKSESEIFQVNGQKNIYSDYDFNLYYKENNQYHPVIFTGTERRIIHIGTSAENRITCLFNPDDGTLMPAGKGISNTSLSFIHSVNLYKQTLPDGKNSIYLRFNTATNQLIRTDITDITELNNQVTKIAFRHFNLFVPENASAEVYLAAHGEQALFEKNTIPDGISLGFYTDKGKALNGHMNDILLLAKGQFPVTERHHHGERIEGYVITQGNEENTDYAGLAKESGNTLISMNKGESDSMSHVMKSVSDIFYGKQINLNLYMCRTRI